MISNLYKRKGWVVKSFKIGKSSIQVELGIDARCRFSCPKCHTSTISHSYRNISVRDLPLASLPVILLCRVVQRLCPKCGGYHTFRPDGIHATMGFTWRLMKLLSDLFRFVPASRLSVLFGLSSATIRRVDREVLSTMLPAVNLKFLKAILIDEKYLGSSCGFVTLVLNAHTGEPVYMAQGRSQECLVPFFESLSDDQRKRIEVVGIDRSNAYQAAVGRYLPDAAICFDHFHVISNLNDALDQVRRREMAQADEAMRQQALHSRFILLRGEEKLKEDARCQLQNLLHANRNICAAHVLKEQFRQMYRAPDANIATWRLVEWLRLVRESSIEPLKRFGRGIGKRFNEVINFFRYRITSGRIEAANAAISRIQAKACGLFDVPYLFLKLRQAFYQQI